MRASLRAGVAEVDITPPMGVELSGYGMYEKRICTEILDRVYARALWLESGEESLVIITADLHSVDLATRNRVAEIVQDGSGLDPRRVMLAVSHTHSGPSAQSTIGWGELDRSYIVSLTALLAQAALEARAALQPAKLGACRCRVTGVGVNREQVELGPVDTSAQLMRVDTPDGTPLAAVVNFGAHPVVRYRFSGRVSADWPGAFSAYIRLAMSGASSLFLQGPSGNVNAHDIEWWWERDQPEIRQALCDIRVGDVAKRFIDQVLPALRRLETRAEVYLSTDWRVIDLPCTTPDRRKLEQVIAEYLPVAEQMTMEELRPLPVRLGNETKAEEDWRFARWQVDWARNQLRLLDTPPYRIEAPIQVFRIGDAALVGWPAEVYMELGLELRQRSPIPLTFVASCANWVLGYIATPAAYESYGKPNQFGTYPVERTPKLYGTLPLRADVGTILVNETLELLSGLQSPLA